MVVVDREQCPPTKNGRPAVGSPRAAGSEALEKAGSHRARAEGPPAAEKVLGVGTNYQDGAVHPRICTSNGSDPTGKRSVNCEWRHRFCRLPAPVPQFLE